MLLKTRWVLDAGHVRSKQIRGEGSHNIYTIFTTMAQWPDVMSVGPCTKMLMRYGLIFTEVIYISGKPTICLPPMQNLLFNAIYSVLLHLLPNSSNHRQAGKGEMGET